MSNSGLTSQILQNQSILGGYSMPSLDTNVDAIRNGMVSNTNNTDNSITQPINMNVQIVNEKGAEQFTKQKLFKAMDEWQRESGRKYR
jgi:hypothetical protein